MKTTNTYEFDQLRYFNLFNFTFLDEIKEFSAQLSFEQLC